MSENPATAPRTIATKAIIYLPALALLGLILLFTVDVPYNDDWGVPGKLCELILEEKAGIYDALFARSYETKNAFPRLIYLATTFAVGWHVPIFHLLNWLCALITFVALLALIPVGRARRPSTFPLLALLLGGLVFSAAQWQNWLWAFQLMQFIGPLCLALCLWIQVSKKSLGTKILLCSALNILATFSPPNGMANWILAFPFLLIPLSSWKSLDRRRKTTVVQWIAIYLGMACLTIGFFYWDFGDSAHTESVAPILVDPALAVRCLLAWVGAPLVGITSSVLSSPDWFEQRLLHENDVEMAISVGATVLVLFAFALVLLWTNRKHESHAALKAGWPWVCLAGFGIAAGVATAIGRGAGGIAEMLAPRYSTNAVWVTIGMVGVLCASWSRGREKNRRARTTLFGAVTGLVALLTLYSWAHGFEKMRGFSAALKQNLLTLRLVDVAPLDPLWQRLTPMPGFRDNARYLMNAGVLKTERIGSWITEKIKQPDDGVAGRFRIVAETERAMRIEGWAALPGTGRPVDCVILVANNGFGRLGIVTGLTVERTDITGMPSDASLRGFRDRFELRFYEEHELQMFAVDLDNRRVYRLDEDAEACRIVSHTLSESMDTAEIKEREPGSVGREAFPLTTAGDRRWGFPQLPDSEVVFRGIFVGRGARLEFGTAVHEQVWSEPGDGVQFEIEVVSRDSKATSIYSQWIDPKNNPDDRRWFDNSIDLAEFTGQEVAIRLRTTCGPAGDKRGDLAFWNRPQVAYRGHGGRIGLAAISFAQDPVRIEHPMRIQRVDLRGRSDIRQDMNLSTHIGTRYSSSDPKIIEVESDGRLIPHAHGTVEVVARNGGHERRVRVVSDWPAVIEFGKGKAGVSGIVPVLDTADELPRLGNSKFRLRVTGVENGAVGILEGVTDPVEKRVDLELGYLSKDGQGHWVQATGTPGVAGGGAVSFPMPIPNSPEFLGRMEYWQGIFGGSRTNGLILTIK